TVRGLLKRGVARAELLDRQPDIQASLFETTGRINQRLGNYAEGQALLERALDLRRSAHGAGSIEAAVTLLAVSQGFVRLARVAAADSAAREALTIQERVLPPDDPAIANTLDQLASVAIYRADVTTAEAHLRRSLEIRRRAFGANDTLTAFGHLAYGSILKRTGHSADAEREYREALAIYLRAHGEYHPQVAESLLKIAY